MKTRILFDPLVTASAGGSGGTTAVVAAPVAAVPPATTTASSAVTGAVWMEPPKPGAAAAAAPDPAKPAAAAADEKFVLTAPKGATMDAAVLEKHGAEMKALGFTQVQAQAILDRDHQSAQAREAAIKTGLEEFDKSELAKLKTAWGDKFVEHSQLVKNGLDYLDPSGALRKDLERAGVAYYGPLAEAWLKVGKLLAPDRLDAPSTQTTKDGKPKPVLKRLEESYRTGKA